MRDIRVLEERFEPSVAIAGLASAAPGAGAIASFVGMVRGGGGDGIAPVEALELTHYEPLTSSAMVALGERACARFGLRGIVMLHRVGRLHLGDPIVCVGAAAYHRREAFDAVDYCMDHLKSAAWFWKRERRGGAWHWIEPRERDHADLARWSD